MTALGAGDPILPPDYEQSQDEACRACTYSHGSLGCAEVMDMSNGICLPMAVIDEQQEMF